MLAEEFEYRKQLKDTVMECRDNAGIEKVKVLQSNKKVHDELKKVITGNKKDKLTLILGKKRKMVYET